MAERLGQLGSSSTVSANAASISPKTSKMHDRGPGSRRERRGPGTTGRGQRLSAAAMAPRCPDFWRSLALVLCGCGSGTSCRPWLYLTTQVCTRFSPSPPYRVRPGSANATNASPPLLKHLYIPPCPGAHFSCESARDYLSARLALRGLVQADIAGTPANRRPSQPGLGQRRSRPRGPSSPLTISHRRPLRHRTRAQILLTSWEQLADTL